MNEKIVNIEYAKKDGFEIVAFQNNKPIPIKFKEYDRKHKNLTYLISTNQVSYIENFLKEKEDLSDLFVKLDIKNINDGRQEICVGYHYSKSTYKYCYDVVEKNKIIPKYSEYHDLVKNEKTIYIKSSLK